MSILVKNGRLLDPASGADKKCDVLIRDRSIAQIGDAGSIKPNGHDVVDATGLWVVPGLIDLHVHLREPGEEYKEDIESGSRAAAAGGFTTVVAMPNTKPAIDNSELVQYIRRRGIEVGLCRVLPTGAVSVKQAGEQLAPFGEMRGAGAVAVTDDGHPVQNAELMRRALEYSRDFDLPVLTHAEEPALSRGGHMHEGEVSTRLGIPGIPRVAEDAAVARDIMLAEYTGAQLHVCHVSTAGAVECLRQAKARGARVSGEAAPHHFALTHTAVEGYDTFAKMSPPLRESSDQQAIVDGLRDGTLEAIATDHAPHTSIEKDVAFTDAQNGVIGLQTALPVSLALWRDHDMPVLDVLHRLTVGPARILGLALGTIAVDATADIAIIDPGVTWRLSRELIASKSANSPFLDTELRGRVEVTIFEGRIVYRRG